MKETVSHLSSFLGLILSDNINQTQSDETNELLIFCTFCGLEILMIFYLWYFLIQVCRYIKYVKTKPSDPYTQSRKMDWYLLTSLFLAALAMATRSTTNLITYIVELQHSKEIIQNEDQNSFNLWFSSNYPELYELVSYFYLSIIGLRNIYIIINMTRWFIVESRLNQILEKQVQALDWIESVSKYGKIDSYGKKNQIKSARISKSDLEFKDGGLENSENNDGASEDFNTDVFFQQQAQLRKISMRKPTIYILSNEIQHTKKTPCWILFALIMLIFGVCSIYGLLWFLDMEQAIFYICIFDYYIISGIIIAGFLKVFNDFFSIMLIQMESQLIPGPQKEEVQKMQVQIGVIFLMIIQKLVFDMLIFSNYGFDDVHIPVIFRISIPFGIFSFASRALLIGSFILQMKMIIEEHQPSSSSAVDKLKQEKDDKSQKLLEYQNSDKGRLVLSVATNPSRDVSLNREEDEDNNQTVQTSSYNRQSDQI